ncbi:glucosamine-6-phosphate deaminase [Bacillaceae bacterium SIJ1]|uniref:glucosamine-6-phosphate deaminase n=1 Tax=Litoribacterium kuwaitense TaxID=1398745 RepID=UPI0013EA79E9|nr:glucosamine-6-phosphate deaminase [Litoribacterium kuwaitense]NGP43956.1 glucosamine-6-phosphate deaminase [Litoribacterium kuwaitense]
MNIKVVDHSAEMAVEAAKIMMEIMKTEEAPVLGLATGGTPETTYRELVKAANEGQVSFKNTTTFNLDEYVGLPASDQNSYRYYMEDRLFNHVDIDRENTHIPDGMAEDIDAEIKAYEEKIKNAGGIDLQLLGIGTNGHIGFNEPGTPFNTRTHVIALDESTREANARYFASIDEVPTHAITMGIESILEAKKILLLISGAKKGQALAEVLYGTIREDVPATALRNHPDVTMIVDQEAYAAAKVPGEEDVHA